MPFGTRTDSGTTTVKWPQEMPNKIAQLRDLIRSTKRRKELGTVIFFVTSRCNAARETCFYHEELNRRGGDDAARRFVKNVAYVGTIMTHYRHQYSNFAKPTAWKFPCTAGETTAVIDYNGNVRACELPDKFASLKDFDYDFSALWEFGSRQDELARIDGGKLCWCTHVCFIHDSLRHSRKLVLTEIPKNYLTREKWL